MWDRVEMKRRAKVAFKKNYGYAVLVTLILGLLSGSFDYTSSIMTQLEQYFSFEMLLTISYVLFVAGILGLIFKIFVGNLFEIGGCRFFILNQTGAPKVGTILDPFRSEFYFNQVKIVFLRNLKVALWALLFFIPGVVKWYEYRMVTYILAENPGMDSREAFDMSREMMYGHKMDCFVLDLSFIGWSILSALTFGILQLLYVGPYMQATYAEVYAFNKWVRIQQQNAGQGPIPNPDPFQNQGPIPNPDQFQNQDPTQTF